MGSARQRRPSESTSASTASASPGMEQDRGPAASAGFQDGLASNSPRTQTADAAEIRRITADMKSLAQRNAWSGVERAYKQMLELDGQIPGEVHALAAQAAQTAGDVRETQMRYRKAKAAGYDADLALASIDDNFISAYISTQAQRPKSDKKAEAGAPVLSIASMPFAPNARKAIEFAQKEFAKSWAFNGMLPHGSYTLEHDGRTTTFEVASFSGRVQETV